MIELVVDPQEADKALLREGAPAREPNLRAPAIVRDTEGTPLLALARYEGDLGEYRRAVRAFPPDTTMRMIGSRNRSRTFGYVTRREVLRRYGCRVCSSALDAPRAHAVIADAAKPIWDTFAAMVPERAELDLATAQVIPEDWRLRGTPWTSGVVNFDSPLPYHFDANNLDAWSAMVTVRREATGGHLHLPQLDLTIECRDGDVLYFAGYKRMHAVTPIKVRRGGYRITSVYYSVAAMKRCAEYEAELAQARAHRSEAEDTMLARQRESGLLDDHV